MQKLRPPAFRRRSRTPTPQEMRTVGAVAAAAAASPYLPPLPVACCSSCNPGASSSPSLAGGAVDYWCSNCQQQQQQLRGSVESLGAVSGCPPSPSPSTSWFLFQQSTPAATTTEESTAARRTSSFLLQLPSDPVPIGGGDNNRARSRSFDWSHQQNSGDSSGGGGGGSSSGPLFGMLRRSFSRNSSTTSNVAEGKQESSGGQLAPSLPLVQFGPSVCVHCQCAEEYERLYGSGSANYAAPAAADWNNDQQRRNWNELEGGDDQEEGEDDDEDEEEEEDEEEDEEEEDESLLGFDDSCSRYGGGGGPASSNTSVRLSFLGDSFECRQKVEPWIRKMNETETPISGVGAASLLRRGRSLGLAPYDTASSSGTMSSHLLPSSAVSGGGIGGGGVGNQLRRGGSECHNRLPSVDIVIGGSTTEQWQQQHQRPQLSTCSFNFSSFSSTLSEPPSSHYPVSPFQSTDASDIPCNSSYNRRSPSPCGTPRLERQEALRSGWLGVSSEPSLDGGRGVSGTAPSLSMETHASASLEVDSGACGGSVSQMQQVSFESQYSTATAPPPSRSSSRHHISSFESETSIDSATSGPGGASARGRLCRSPLLSRRKCLSAGASPCSSPPICLSNSRHNLTGRNLCTGSSSEYGDQPDQSPSPPAEIYLTVPNILVAAPPATAKTAAAAASASTSLLDKSRHLRQKFKRHAESSRSSSDSKDTTGAATASIHHQSQQQQPQPTAVAAAVRSQLTAFDSNLVPPFRSRSIEVGLPTAHHHVDYHELAGSARRHHWVSRLKKNNPGELEITSENGERRVLRSTPDWTDEALLGDHLWVPTSASGDLCYVAVDQDCTRTGPRLKCSSCRIVAHITCVPHMKFPCRPTFWDGADLRQYRTENTDTTHHWVHRRSQTGKCQNCYKSFQSKLSFGSKEIVAITCSWCKAAYHNKDHCFNMDRYKEPCSLGGNHNIIVPPSWIVKLPARENFKSSLRKSSRGAGGGRNSKNSSRRSKRSGQGDGDGAIAPMAAAVTTSGGESKRRSFVVKPIPTAGSRPIIVFINPKSGGNQGAKLMQKFQWLLNPRQVFDLTQGGPRAGLEMFRKVPNLRVLACGGDGTAGWVLSILDQIGISPAPPVGVLPLGTGNDLARALGWGGGYTDEPISKILSCMGDAEPVMLDRWELQVEKNEEASQSCNDGGDGGGGHHPSRDTLPLSVVNNYFSFGVDAQIALDFHEAREARPQKFNSRLRNKMFYGQAGGKDLLQRKWKDLSEFVTLECDGKDITGKLREQKVHAVLFLNIPSYGGGTHPWAGNHGQAQATDDGLIEVVGLTTYQLPLLQAGGHGTCLAQCRTARIVTRRVIPMQVDGEACRLNPAIINLQLLNQAPVLAKRRGGFERNRAPIVETLRMHVKRISMADYEVHHYEKEALQAAATSIGVINVNRDAILEAVRRAVNGLLQENCSPNGGGGDAEKLESDWCFVDCCTAERVFRVDTGQEHLHYITDITATEDLFILDPLSSSVNSVQDIEGCSVANGGGSSTAAGLVDDAGIEDMVQLANSQLQKQQQHYEAARIKEPLSPIDAPVDSFLIPSNIKSPLLEKSSSSVVKAAKEGDLKKLKDLHASGFSLLSIDAQGQTALHWAARHGHKDVTKYLLAAAPTAILDMVDNEKGHTALHKAALSKQRAISCMLVAAGASLSLMDRDRLTPRGLAERAGDMDLAVYLESQENFNKSSADNVETCV